MKYVLLIAALSFAVFFVPKSQAFAAGDDGISENNSNATSPFVDDVNITEDLARPGGGGGGGGHAGGGGGHPGGGGFGGGHAGGGGHPGGGGGHPGGGGHVGGGGHAGGGGHGGGHPGGGHGDYHVGHGYGGSGFREGYRAGRWGWHGGIFLGYPGWYAGWGWDYAWFPFWYTSTILWPAWAWDADAPVGYYQCTAFNQELQPFTAVGPDMNQATYGALQLCADGGDPQDSGCYIPQGYCRLR